MEKKTCYLLIGILFVTFCAYIPALNNDFTNWDDENLVTGNLDIRALSYTHIQRIFSITDKYFYQPLSIFSFALEYKFFKLDPFVYHLDNIILHLINTALVFFLIYILTENVFVCFVAALLFGIHPVHVESIAWVSERKDVLYGLFFLGGCISYILYVKRHTRRVRFFAATLVLFILSLLSKPAAITFPGVLVVFDYYLGRINKRTIVEKIPFVLLSVFFGLIAIKNPVSQIDRYFESSSIFIKLLISVASVLFYSCKALVPMQLCSFYPHPGILQTLYPIIYYLAPFILLLGAWGILISRKYSKDISFGFSFFLVTIVISLQVIYVRGYIIADRYMYLALIGIIFIVSTASDYLINTKLAKRRCARMVAIVALAVYCGLLSFKTVERCMVWRDSEALWSDVIRQYPGSPFAYINRGIYYDELGEEKRAIDDFDQAIKVMPGLATTYNNRGVIFEHQEDFTRALDDYNMALQQDSLFVPAYNNRGSLYVKMKHYEKAVADYMHVIELNPEYLKAYINLGIVYKMIGRQDLALKRYSQAIDIHPGYDVAYLLRGELYDSMGNADAALADYNEAIRYNSLSAENYAARGGFFQKTKKFDRALRDYKKALALDDGYKVVYLNRSKLYEELRNYEGALQDLKMLQELLPENETLRNRINALEKGVR